MPPSNPQPSTPARPDDLTTIEEFALFMDDTDRSVSVRTYQRWIRQAGLRTWPDYTDPKRQLVSMTDLLKLHRRRQKD